MNESLLELFRHQNWATLRLIEHCQGLEDEHLDATTPGTYGSIRETLRHLVESDENYYSMLTRQTFRSKAEAAAYVPPHQPQEGPVPLAELAERIRRMGPRWEALAEREELSPREVTSRDGWRMPAEVVMAQAVHHAGDHRTHVMSILGARGLELPGPNDLDVWGYAEAAGQAEELPAT
jgi:uncharacterized damage-inducible protein DinB